MPNTSNSSFTKAQNLEKERWSLEYVKKLLSCIYISYITQAVYEVVCSPGRKHQGHQNDLCKS